MKIDTNVIVTAPLQKLLYERTKPLMEELKEEIQDILGKQVYAESTDMTFDTSEWRLLEVVIPKIKEISYKHSKTPILVHAFVEDNGYIDYDILIVGKEVATISDTYNIPIDFQEANEIKSVS